MDQGDLMRKPIPGSVSSWTQELMAGTKRERQLIIEIMVEDLLGWSRPYMMRKANPSEQMLMNDGIGKINDGWPVQYVSGVAHFMGHRLHVDQRVLIPRPETEELSALTVDLLRSGGLMPCTLLDLGTGSGCLALSIKAALPMVEVWAADISEGALDVAHQNAQRMELEIRWLLGDLLEDIGLTPVHQWDAIISNPPYISAGERELMDRSVLEFEPQEALFPPDGDVVGLYRKVISYADATLVPGGFVALELNEFMAEEIFRCTNDFSFQESTLILDAQGKKRFLYCRKRLAG